MKPGDVCLIENIRFFPEEENNDQDFSKNLSKNFELADKYSFGIGASISSFLFFFILGYLSKFMSYYLKNPRVWKIINYFIIFFMSGIALFVLREIINFYW